MSSVRRGKEEKEERKRALFFSRESRKGSVWKELLGPSSIGRLVNVAKKVCCRFFLIFLCPTIVISFLFLSLASLLWLQIEIL